MRALTTSTQASGVGRDDARYRPERVVDGVGAQVIAPVIVPLVSDGGSTLSSEDAAQGGAAAPDKGATRTAYTVERLRQKIWQMVFQAQSRLSQGCAPTPTQTLAVTHAGRRRRAAGCSRVTQRSGRGGGAVACPGTHPCWSRRVTFSTRTHCGSKTPTATGGPHARSSAVFCCVCSHAVARCMMALADPRSLTIDQPLPFPEQSFNNSFYRCESGPVARGRSAQSLTVRRDPSRRRGRHASRPGMPRASSFQTPAK